MLLVSNTCVHIQVHVLHDLAHAHVCRLNGCCIIIISGCAFVQCKNKEFVV